MQLWLLFRIAASFPFSFFGAALTWLSFKIAGFYPVVSAVVVAHSEYGYANHVQAFDEPAGMSRWFEDVDEAGASVVYSVNLALQREKAAWVVDLEKEEQNGKPHERNG